MALVLPTNATYSGDTLRCYRPVWFGMRASLFRLSARVIFPGKSGVPGAHQREGFFVIKGVDVREQGRSGLAEGAVQQRFFPLR